MSTNTTNMAMGKAVDGDNARTYLETTLGAALDLIDAHNHSGTTHALAIPYGSIGAVAWTTFTPALSQSASVTASTANGRYVTMGKSITMSINMTLTSAGTATNAIVIDTMPTAFAAGVVVGSGVHIASGGVRTLLSVVLNSTTQLAFYANAGTGLFGTNPAVTIANGDILRCTISYEAA